ncbi:MAG: right-handed parallel beta-helix repeat-containing protein [Candidatus Eisenbacteria sp.]|nr:right-handed parallel beta-helix repeat-containing protein [Candidatus Eisenbacteria bacterium]
MPRSISIVCMLFALAPAASTTTYVIAPDTSGDYPTIQAGIDAASPGDTLELTSGTFSGLGNRNLDYGGKAITIRSETGDPAYVTITGDGVDRGFIFTNYEGSDSVLEGVTIYDGYKDIGAGIACFNSSPTIINCVIASCGASLYGGGFYCGACSPTLTDCAFATNSAGQYGGALSCTWGSAPALTGCTFSWNTAPRGGGLGCQTSSAPELSGCTFDHNTGTANGGAVYVVGTAALSLTTCDLLYNTAMSNGGGLYVESDASATLTTCSFYDNQANKGGAICLSSSRDVSATSCSITHNDATAGGGGLYCYAADSSNVFFNCTIESNTTAGDGGGMHCRSASPQITQCTFRYNLSSAGSGGGLFCREASAPQVLECTFRYNDAELDGGGLYCSASPATLTDCEVYRNDALGNGGGARLIDASHTISGCTFAYNEAGGSGGGVSFSGDVLTVTACDIRNNDSGGGSGDGMRIYAADFALTDCLIAENLGIGLTVYADDDEGLIADCTIAYNTGSGMFVCEDADPYVLRTIIAFNEGQAIQMALGIPVTADADLTCCNLYGNTNGDYTVYLADELNDPSNISADPLFCDASSNDYRIAIESPSATASCGLMGGQGIGCGIAITGITDVGNDQGRQVYVTWARSFHDIPDSPYPITHYSLWRRIDEFAARGAEGEPRVMTAGGDRAFPPGDWCFVKDVPAYGEKTYTTVCPTVCDSTIGAGACWSSFFVRAGTLEPTTSFDCLPDSGYSVDNLAPGVPEGLRLESPDVLAWEECAAADFDYFTVYGSATDHLDETAVVIGYTIGSTMDVGGASHDYYHVTATDFAGNEGEEATLDQAAGAPESQWIPQRYALYQNRPNPGRPGTLIRFDLPSPGEVRLEIFDVAGRRVTTLLDGPRPAGVHSVAWAGTTDDGQPVESGVFFFRLRAGSFSKTRQLMIAR